MLIFVCALALSFSSVLTEVDMANEQGLTSFPVPTMLRNSLVSWWPALKWTPDHLMKHLPETALPVYVNTERLFVYYNSDAVLASHFEWALPFETVRMPASNLLRRLADAELEDDGAWHVFSGSTETLGSHASTDMPGIEGLGVGEHGFSPNIWLSQKGVTTQLHYDSYHNVFVQIHGSKRFVLIPPEEWQRVHLSPRLHPLVSQSLLDVDEVLSNITTAVEVVLHPGDVMYLPPFWGHHVETLSHSISVNVWTDSQEYEVWSELLMSAIPFEEDWDAEKTTVATTLYIQAVVEAALDLSPVEAKTFVAHLWRQRYAPLSEGFLKGRLLEEVLDDARGRLCRPQQMEALAEELHERTHRGAASLLDHWAKMSTTDVRPLYVGNYIEELAAAFVGVDDVFAFLGACF